MTAADKAQSRAAAALVSALPTALRAPVLRMLWRMVPKSARQDASLTVARRYAPARLPGLRGGPHPATTK
jgi:hypothetical protein